VNANVNAVVVFVAGSVELSISNNFFPNSRGYAMKVGLPQDILFSRSSVRFSSMKWFDANGGFHGIHENAAK